MFGTCAGLILLSKHVQGEEFDRISTMDTEVCRNAYGRQLGSFYAEAEMNGVGVVPMTFIRAPYIKNVEAPAEALAVVDGHIVAARQGFFINFFLRHYLFSSLLPFFSFSVITSLSVFIIA